MSNIVAHRKFSLTNIGNNNNKFWNVTLYDNGTVESKFGRQGDSGQTRTWNDAGESFMLKKIREKERKGYKENKVIDASSNISNDIHLSNIAKKQIKSQSTIVKSLIDFLVATNAHQIFVATGGKITYDTSSAVFKTTQGIVDPSQVDEARVLLTDISKYVTQGDYDNSNFLHSVNNYFSLIPRNLGRHKPDIKDLFKGTESIQKENDILDGLESSFAGAVQQIDQDKEDENIETPEVFNVDMDEVTDPDTLDKIGRMYRKTKNNVHTSSRYDIVKIYSININSVRERFKEKGEPIGNIQELWHGTKCSNLLSIMRQGLIIPPSNASYCTGRMFGNGLYFSDQSTKSLNYATNFWSSGGNSKRIFMFLADVAMGKSYTPYKPSENLPKSGYDSTFAKAGKSRVMNNEMIVYNTYQADLKYLIEFK